MITFRAAANAASVDRRILSTVVAVSADLRILSTFAAALAVSSLLALRPASAAAGVQTSDQQRCINVLNKAARRVSTAQAAVQRACLADVAAGKAVDAASCIEADAKGKVAKARAKAMLQAAKKCSETPAFAYTGADQASAAAQSQRLALLNDMLDSGSGLTILSRDADAAAAKCQKKVVKAADVFTTKALATFNACKKETLAAGATDAVALVSACVDPMPSLADDPDAALGAAAARMLSARTTSCSTVDLPTAFPGACAAESTADEFDRCLRRRALCRVCLALDTMDALGASCDLVDDAVANASCGGTSTTTLASTTTTAPPTSTTVPVTTTLPTTTTLAPTTTVTTTSTTLPPEFIVIAVGDTVSNGVPEPGAGNIETAGSQDFFAFFADSGEEVFFDELGGNFIPWRTEDGGENPVFGLTHLNGGQPGRIVLSRGGWYRIFVGNPGDPNTGTYSFKLWAVPADHSFAIAIGDTVSNGVPGSGAGNIETPGVHDLYTFAGTAGDEIFFDELAQSGLLNHPLTLRDPDGDLVFQNNLAGGDPGRLTLELTGTYTVDVGSHTSDAVGTYSFKIWEVPADQTFAIAIGEIVSNGSPSSGAGNIEVPSTRDFYTFTGAAGQEVYFDELSLSGLLNLPYRLLDPNGTVVFNNNLGGGEPGRRTLTLTGTYTLEVGTDTSDATGTYSLRILSVPADDEFAIAIGDTVASGAPMSGAGTIETPGAHDIYTFTASAGEEIYFDELSQSGLLNLPYVVTDEDGATVFSNNLAGGEPGRRVLTRGGTYTIDVGSDTSDATGTYSFRILAQPADDTSSISIGDVVSDGFPETGDGNIEVPGAHDIYTFSAAAGEVVYFDELSQTGLLNLPYLVTDEDGATVFSNNLAGGEPGRRVLTRGGEYTVDVGSDTSDATGTYSFTIRDQPDDDVTAIEIGDTVSNGSPESGDGNIEVPGAHDLYTFEAEAGDVVNFQEGAFSGVLNLPWKCTHSSGTVVFTNNIGGASPGNKTLTQAGTYTIDVGSDTSDATGTYGFTITLVP
ncbi:MAG TPA: hypothetical protein VEC57_00965 [Candidatus Limnocylindrales bacterium]|nr:hypothetical protein [Candidatus Limnocylindrales bacterium]